MKKILSFLLLANMFLVANGQNASSPFHMVVSVDGSGDYKRVQDAIDAVPDGCTEPWLIFIKNGHYNEQVVIPKEKTYVHLIGQDKEKTVIHLNLNVGGQPKDTDSKGKIAFWETSVHNPQSPVHKYEGTVVLVKGKNFYTENISYVNDFGVLAENGPQALAMNSQADCASFYNCKFRSFQDTWMTATNDTCRHYIKDCWIEGAVDYLYGGGDVLVENSTFYNVRSGSVIVAPCHTNAQYGYVFRDCTVDGNELAADGGQKLGRPWHNNPKTTYINTTMLIPIAEDGWSNMGTIPELFAEYNSRDKSGELLDLSKRKTDYEHTNRETGVVTKGTARATVTKAEADAMVYENMIPGKDGWNPRVMMHSLDRPGKPIYEDGLFSWQPVKGAIGYVVMDGEKVLGTTTSTSFPVKKVSHALKVCAVNKYGSLGMKRVL